MRKLKVLPLLAMVFVIFFACIQSAYAATITELKYENNKISLSGTGTEQVQIVLFGLDNSPLYMTTASVEGAKFNITLPEISDLKDGDYTVKVADYDGTSVDNKTIAILKENSLLAKTGDEISLYICNACVAMAIVSGAVLLFLRIRKNAKNIDL